jgi:hypothetical protein
MNETSKPRKIRAKNLPENRVGIQRHEIYKQAYEHISLAMEKGFYLESITLIESMISDRLESRLSLILQKDFSFRTLGNLIDQMKTSEKDQRLQELVSNEIDGWRSRRNNALHEMVKVEMGDSSRWEDRITKLPEIAKTGLDLLKKVSKRVETLNNK